MLSNPKKKQPDEIEPSKYKVLLLSFLTKEKNTLKNFFHWRRIKYIFSWQYFNFYGYKDIWNLLKTDLIIH